MSHLRGRTQRLSVGPCTLHFLEFGGVLAQWLVTGFGQHSCYILQGCGSVICRGMSVTCPTMTARPEDATSVRTIRRKIVALSFLCFFSSDFLFLFSRLAAMRYSFKRRLRSHSFGSTSLPFWGLRLGSFWPGKICSKGLIAI